MLGGYGTSDKAVVFQVSNGPIREAFQISRMTWYAKMVARLLQIVG
jgi:hypothetical protein